MRSGADVGRDGSSPGFEFVAKRVRAQSTYAAIVGLVVVASYAIALWVRVIDPLVVGVGLWSELFRALPYIVVTHLVATVVADRRAHPPVGATRVLRVALANLVATTLTLSVAVFTRIWSVEWAPLVPFTVIILGGVLTTLTMGMLTFRQRFLAAS